jgi:hypothetical protein
MLTYFLPPTRICTWRERRIGTLEHVRKHFAHLTSIDVVVLLHTDTSHDQQTAEWCDMIAAWVKTKERSYKADVFVGRREGLF